MVMWRETEESLSRETQVIRYLNPMTRGSDHIIWSCLAVLIPVILFI